LIGITYVFLNGIDSWFGMDLNDVIICVSKESVSCDCIWSATQIVGWDPGPKPETTAEKVTEFEISLAATSL
jgi:hypothetical protein